MITYIHDSILNAKHGSIIIQQVNCMNKMGAGLAKAIADVYPFVKRGYHEFCKKHEHEGLLGRYQVSKCDRYVFVNMFTQKTYGRTGLHTDYEVFFDTLCNICNKVPKGSMIALPYGIGCGLAGGDWDVVSKIIQSVAGYYPELEFHIYDNRPIQS